MRTRRKKTAAVDVLQGFDPKPAQLAELRKWRRERWEELFLFQCRSYNLPPVSREHKFALGMGRQWRFDFAWLPFLTAVEIEGIVVHGRGKSARFGFGRHHSVAGFTEDMRKYNAAQLLGWAVLRFDQQAVKSGAAVLDTAEMLRRRGWTGSFWPGPTVTEATHAGGPQSYTAPASDCHRGALPCA